MVRTLRLDGRAVASQLATIGAGTLVLYKVAYDEAHADLSPSNILLADLIGVCCDRPDVDRIDLVTKQPWHERWQAVAHPSYRARDLNVRRPGAWSAGSARCWRTPACACRHLDPSVNLTPCPMSSPFPAPVPPTGSARSTPTASAWPSTSGAMLRLRHWCWRTAGSTSPAPTTCSPRSWPTPVGVVSWDQRGHGYSTRPMYSLQADLLTPSPSSTGVLRRSGDRPLKAGHHGAVRPRCRTA